MVKTNTECLCLALGWQGGTVYQVAEVTGLTVSEIIDTKSDDPVFMYNADCVSGWFALRTCTQKHRLDVCNPPRKGNLPYWMGQVQGVKMSILLGDKISE